MKIEDILSFIKEVDLLKKIERQALIHNEGRRENSVEHSWHLAVVALVLQSFSPENIDINKAIKMAILHDIVEIYAVDTLVYSDLTGKQEAELKALEPLMSFLSLEFSNTLKEIWLEFDKGDYIF